MLLRNNNIDVVMLLLIDVDWVNTIIILYIA